MFVLFHFHAGLVGTRLAWLRGKSMEMWYQVEVGQLLPQKKMISSEEAIKCKYL